MDYLLFDTITLIIASIGSIYIYKKTYNDIILLGTTGLISNALFTLTGIMFNIPNIWIMFDISSLGPGLSCIFIGTVLLSYIAVAEIIRQYYKTQYYKSIIVTTIAMISSIILCYIISHTLFVYSGLTAMIVVAIAAYWAKQQPCINPWTCGK